MTSQMPFCRISFVAALVLGASVGADAVETITLDLDGPISFRFAGACLIGTRGLDRAAGLEVVLRPRPAGVAGNGDWVFRCTAADPTAAWSEGRAWRLLAAVPSGQPQLSLTFSGPALAMPEAAAPAWRLVGQGGGCSVADLAVLRARHPTISVATPPPGRHHELLIAAEGASAEQSARLARLWVAGWQAVAADPAAAVAAVAARSPLSREHLLPEAEAVLSGLGARPDGGIDARWWHDHATRVVSQGGAALWRPDLAGLATEPPARATSAPAPSVPRTTATVLVSVPAQSETKSGVPADPISLPPVQTRAAISWPWLVVAGGVVALVVSLTFYLRQREHQTKEIRRHGDSLRRATEIQRKLLPTLPRLAGWEIAAHYRPHDGVGGDFYQVGRFPDGRWVILLGDVSGHGMHAAMIATAMMKESQHRIPRHSDLGLLLAACHQAMAGELPAGYFITVVAVALEPATGTATCVCAGHPNALLVGAGGTRPVGAMGPALGLGHPPANAWPTGEVVHIGHNERLVLYTDGLSEARRRDGEEFGIQGIVAAIATHAGLGAEAAACAIAETASAHTGGKLDDDLTVLVLATVPPDLEPTEA